jgi:hypothetical protein
MKSYYPASQSLPWLHHPYPGMDSEKLYARNRLHHSDELKKQGWWEYEPFDYHFNSQGFRSNEFDTDIPGIMYLGCSLTLGEALPAELTWPQLVSKSMGQPCWNLGQSGAAMDTCFRLAEHWIPLLKPTQVMLLIPPQERLELIDANGTPCLYSAQGFSPGAREWLAHPENGRLSELKNLWAIRDLCCREQIPLYSWHFVDFYKLTKQNNSYGRDLSHPGKIAHKMFTERVLREIDADGVD